MSTTSDETVSEQERTPIEKENKPLSNVTADQTVNEINEVIEPVQKRTRFNASEDVDSKWDLSDELAKYVNKAFKGFIADKILKEKVLEENPVPTNIAKCKKLDTFLKKLLEESGKKYCVKGDESLLAVQERIRNVFGPLSKVWASIEEEREFVFENIKDPMVAAGADNIAWNCNLNYAL